MLKCAVSHAGPVSANAASPPSLGTDCEQERQMKSAGKRRTKIYHTVVDGSYHTATHAFSGRPKVNGEQVKCTKNQFRIQNPGNLVFDGVGVGWVSE